MPVKAVYLTIDDAPSKHMHKKVDFLFENKIPAVFYCRGEFIKEYSDQVVYAINKGFLIGNHSYSHPYFSEISLEKCKHEINKTEKLIDECYSKSNFPRSTKIIRLPFADRGAGKNIKIATTETEKQKVHQIQVFLCKKEFVPIIFNEKEGSFIDSFWDWDLQDYKSKFINNPFEYKTHLSVSFTRLKEEAPVVLMHDFANNHHLFDLTMSFLIEKRVTFLSPTYQ